MQLNVKKFFTVCTHLAFESAKIIQSVHQSSSLKTILKSQNDPVTEADFKVQSLITKALRSYWPQIKIVGEEDKEYEGEINFNFEKLQKPIFDTDHFSKGKRGEHLPETLNLQKMIVWIDPLDGTLSYTQGYLNEVTTLIGVSYEGKARLGIIGSYYQKTNVGGKKKYEFNPRVFVGDRLNSNAYQVNSNLDIQKIYPRTHNNITRLCVSRSHLSRETEKRMGSISNCIQRMGGIGKKALEVIEDRADTFVYLGQGIGSWDVCAVEAVIESVNGRLTKASGERLDYSIAGKHLVEGGAVLCIDDELQQQVLHKIKIFKQ